MNALRRLASLTVFLQLLNAGLRLASLCSKLLLTLYMGRYLGLTEMGTYGLVAAYVAIAIPLLGMRLDYVVSRDIIGLEPLPLTHRMRDQLVFYGINYALFAVAVAIYLLCFGGSANLGIGLFVLVLAITESLGAFTSGNLVSLKRPILSTILFFIRSALWVFPVMAVGFFMPEFRTANFIFACWLVGVLISLGLTAYVWRLLPWAKAMAQPVDWAWVRRSVTVSFPIWLGAVGAAAAGNLDRFVVEHFLGRDFVGIASFYASFVGAMIGLLQNGVMSFGYPKLVAHFKNGEQAAFKAEAWRMTWQAGLSVGIMSVAVALLVPYLGNQFGRPEFAQYAATLWLMLFGVWLKSLAESLYYVLYARHQDRPIWIGNIVLLGVSLATNIVFVPAFGFIGIGYSALCSAIFIALWRLYWVMKYS